MRLALALAVVLLLGVHRAAAGRKLLADLPACSSVPCYNVGSWWSPRYDCSARDAYNSIKRSSYSSANAQRLQQVLIVAFKTCYKNTWSPNCNLENFQMAFNNAGSSDKYGCARDKVAELYCNMAVKQQMYTAFSSVASNWSAILKEVSSLSGNKLINYMSTAVKYAGPALDKFVASLDWWFGLTASGIQAKILMLAWWC